MYGIVNLGGEDTDHDGKTSGNRPEQTRMEAAEDRQKCRPIKKPIHIVYA